MPTLYLTPDTAVNKKTKPLTSWSLHANGENNNLQVSQNECNKKEMRNIMEKKTKTRDRIENDGEIFFQTG